MTLSQTHQDLAKKIIELEVGDFRGEIERSAEFIKEDIKGAQKILKEKFGIN